MAKKKAAKKTDLMQKYLDEVSKEAVKIPTWMREGAYGISYRKVPGMNAEVPRVIKEAGRFSE